MPAALVPDTMKAVLWKGYGGYDQLEFRDDVAAPSPQPGAVVVRIGAASVNNTDINTRIGWYSRAVSEGTGVAGAAQGHSSASAENGSRIGTWTGTQHQFPRIQGADGCGRIVAVGDGVSTSRIGERVLIEPIIRLGGLEGTRFLYFGSECNGSFAEYASVPSVNAHAISSDLSDAELASYPCAYSAAEHMVERSQIKPGQDVLITGASGGVGSAAVQLAARRGARVIAVSSPAKAAAIAALGATRVVDRGANLKALLGEESIDAVIFAISSDT
jgi:NADPH:quinone reductase-like Zn-dependent oxidoreductase